MSNILIFTTKNGDKQCKENKKILIQQTCKYIDINIYDETIQKTNFKKSIKVFIFF